MFKSITPLTMVFYITLWFWAAFSLFFIVAQFSGTHYNKTLIVENKTDVTVTLLPLGEKKTDAPVPGKPVEQLKEEAEIKTFLRVMGGLFRINYWFYVSGFEIEPGGQYKLIYDADDVELDVIVLKHGDGYSQLSRERLEPYRVSKEGGVLEITASDLTTAVDEKTIKNAEFFVGFFDPAVTMRVVMFGPWVLGYIIWRRRRGKHPYIVEGDFSQGDTSS